MIFQYTYQYILGGSKTQTRRVAKPEETAVYAEDSTIEAVLHKGRTKYRVGKTYAVQPARTKPALARIQLQALKHEVVTDISLADAIAEGYADVDGFLQSWRTIHGEKAMSAQVWVLVFSVVEVEK